MLIVIIITHNLQIKFMHNKKPVYFSVIDLQTEMFTKNVRFFFFFFQIVGKSPFIHSPDSVFLYNYIYTKRQLHCLFEIAACYLFSLIQNEAKRRNIQIRNFLPKYIH